MFGWLLKRLEARGRKAVILDRDGIAPYLVRYYALFPDSLDRERKDIPFNILIHQFMQGDDPVLHDHPWWYCTIILKGGYWEHLISGERVWRGPGSIRWGANVIHWIELPEGGEGKTWTLFIRGKTKRSWGFYSEKYDRPGALQYVPWQRYLDEHRKQP